MRPEDLMNIPGLDLEQISDDIYHKQIALGQKAREVTENEAFVLAFQQLRAYLLVQWEQTDITNTERREALWHQLQCAQLFHENLTVMLETGKVARTNLDMQERNSKVTQVLKKVMN